MTWLIQRSVAQFSVSVLDEFGSVFLLGEFNGKGLVEIRANFYGRVLKIWTYFRMKDAEERESGHWSEYVNGGAVLKSYKFTVHVLDR